MSRPRLGCLALTLALALASAHSFAQAPPGSVGDQARRRQMAAELKRQGVDIDWRLATAAELQDWLLRAAEARALRDRCAMQTDWRTYSLVDLKDWNGRCARAAALAKLGLQVDWKAYTLPQLNALTAFVQQMRSPDRGGAAPILPADLPPGFDPDAIIIPSSVGGGSRPLDDSILPPSGRKGGKSAPPARAAVAAPAPARAAVAPPASARAPVAAPPPRAPAPAHGPTPRPTAPPIAATPEPEAAPELV